MDVVNFAVELDQLGAQISAPTAHDGFAVSEHVIGEHLPAIFRHVVTNTRWAWSKETLWRVRR